MKPGSVVIAGVGRTDVGKLPGRTTVSLNVEACRAALADAGLEKERVDAVFVKAPTSKPEVLYGQKVAAALGLEPRIGGVWDQGGAANISMISFAALSIEAGQCEVALVTIADNPRTGSRQAYEQPHNEDAVYGWFGTLGAYGMIARRHMIEYGTTAEHFAAVAINSRAAGAANPAAQLRSPLTLEEYLEAPYVVDPLRRPDCSLISDGAAAVVVMSKAMAQALGVARPVPILGFGQGQTSIDVPYRSSLTETAATVSAATAFRMAGLTPAQIDVGQLYDCFTIVPIMTLEDYGFCAKGDGGRFVASGAITPQGSIPINTSGGLLSHTGMPGMQLVQEGVLQMRGSSTTQIAGAKTCVISNQGGIMTTHSTLIVGA
jgi:acetyl-CoA acetyltransferase